DSSGSSLTVSLLENGTIISELIEPPEQNGRQEALSRLMPAIDTAVQAAGWEKEDIDILVVGIGPGSFTGIRTCVVTARTLAQALGLPLIGLDSMFCHALDLELPGVIITGGGRGHFFVASYAMPKDSTSLPEVLQPPTCIKADDIESHLKGAERVYVESELKHNFKGMRSCPCNELPRLSNLASTQALVAWKTITSKYQHVNEDVDGLAKEYDFQRVLPLYLRNPSITLKK
ncbi:MAG: tRNA (adenosine(37)-N6)-threonylcarbamoyltransferase complex dimerization subunit type 1 TsaB, partial [Cyanobacteria bacterium]|nr:tRNA (adenosine(37)-N6)-threonylcarbamoyltransferase complex dimerization subunit type 1 TsaB [Cyanobacteriota bacterium]